jgi:hypothetical protein
MEFSDACLDKASEIEGAIFDAQEEFKKKLLEQHNWPMKEIGDEGDRLEERASEAEVEAVFAVARTVPVSATGALALLQFWLEDMGNGVFGRGALLLESFEEDGASGTVRIAHSLETFLRGLE